MEQSQILVLVEKENGHSAAITFELLKAGKELSGKGKETVCACVLGHEVSDLAAEMAYYADQVFVIDNPFLANFQGDLYASALLELCRAIKPSAVLMGHTYDSLELAPKLAAKMGNDVITDCVKIEREDETGALLCTKPIYGGNAIAVLHVNTKPQVVTLRPKVMDALEKGNVEGKVVPFKVELGSSIALTQSLAVVPGESVSLDKADAIVAGGRGVKEAEGIHELEGLVGALRRFFGAVELGASRPLVDAGFLPHSRQIGQTGEKVSPQLYIAVAISGAAQHMAGIVGSKKIIAINSNIDAPIFEGSDYGVVGKYEEVVPALINQLKELS